MKVSCTDINTNCARIYRQAISKIIIHDSMKQEWCVLSVAIANSISETN